MLCSHKSCEREHLSGGIDPINAPAEAKRGSSAVSHSVQQGPAAQS